MKNNITKTFKRSVAAVAVTAVLSMSTAFADTGGLKFKVTDSAGKPVVGASVNVHTSESLVSRKGVTDSNGYLRLTGLDPSTKYEVEISGQGYTTLSRENVRVVSGKSFNVNYKLSSTIDNIEVITVR